MSSHEHTRSEGTVCAVLCCIVILLLCCSCRTKKETVKQSSEDSVAVYVDSSVTKTAAHASIDSILSAWTRSASSDDSSRMTAHIVRTVYANGTSLASDTALVGSIFQPIAEQTVIDFERTGGTHSESSAVSSCSQRSASSFQSAESTSVSSDSVRVHADSTAVNRETKSAGFVIGRTLSAVAGIAGIFFLLAAIAMIIRKIHSS